MATIEELRSAFPHAEAFSDDVLRSPHFHLGVLESHMDEMPDQVRLSLSVIADELSGPGCDCGVCP